MNPKPEKSFLKQPVIYLLLLFTGATGALLGDRWLELQHSQASLRPQSQTAPTPSATGKNTLSQTSLPTWLVQKPLSPLPKASDANFIVAAVNQVGPAVVRINASRQAPRSGFNRFDDSFPNDFFGFEQPPRRQPGPLEQGTGSGFILSPEGHIMTNAHVVEGADTVQVVLKDGRRFEGQVLGSDPITDVAVVKINAIDLPVVHLGDSDALSPGEWAIAIGNPLGLDNSVTVGIISATGRSSSDVGVPDKRIGFIQTDAAINPGNSGGPLLNANGEVVGMNTAIISGAQGLGFAIPISKAQQIAQQLITKGQAEHAYLGVEMVTMTPELRQQLSETPDLDFPILVDEGVLIVDVVPNSPAAQAGLKPGDIILKLDEKPISKSETVQEIVQNQAVGSILKMEINRRGQTLTIDVRSGNLPSQLQG